MNRKSLIFVSLLSAIFLVSLVGFISAQTISDSVANINVAANPHSTQLTLNFNTAGQSWDTQKIPASYYNNTLLISSCPHGISFSVSDLLNGVNAAGAVTNGVVSFSSVSIQNPDNIIHLPIDSSCVIQTGYTAESFLTLLKLANYSSYTASQLNNNPSLLNQLVAQNSNLSKYFSVAIPQIPGTATFDKSGNTLIITYDKGFEDVSNYQDYLNQLITGVIPTTYNNNIENLINNYVLSGILNQSLVNSLNYNFVASADLSSLSMPLQNGPYTIPVAITSGSNVFSKNVYVTVSGITTPATPNTVDSNGNFVPSDTSTIQSITGLTPGATVSFQVLNDPSSLGIPAFSQSGISAIQYLKIDVSAGASNGGTIYFNLNNPSGGVVNLYVWDTSSNSWQGPYTANLVSGNKYSVTVPHFSTYVITQTLPSTTTTPNTNGYPYPGYVPSSPAPVVTNTNSNTNQNNNNPTPTNLNNPSNGGITGAVVGALTSPGGITFLVLLVLGVGTVLFVVARRKIAKRK